MTLHPIHDAIAATRHQVSTWFHPYHQQEAPVNRLAETIKADLAAAGHQVDQAMHDILAHRLSIASVLNYAADEMTRLQASPLAGLAERYVGLDPAIAATVVHVADIVAADGARMLAGPVPVAPSEPTPAQP